jgi:hypothetical protein
MNIDPVKARGHAMNIDPVKAVATRAFRPVPHERTSVIGGR